MTHTRSSVCVIGPLTCMGCCGHHFTNKNDMTVSLRKNTHEFRQYDDLEEFRDRYDPVDLHKSGVCRNLVFKEDNMKIMCPLHPAINGEDLRVDHCDTYHLCRTSKLFNIWPEERKKAFLKFITSKELDWHSYSVGMISNSLLEEFQSLEKTSPDMDKTLQ